VQGSVGLATHRVYLKIHLHLVFNLFINLAMIKYLDILIGLPATGKSTYADEYDGWTILSTDDNVMEMGNGLSYDEAWKKYIGKADNKFFADLLLSIQHGKDIVVDRTNMTVKSRSRIFNLINRSGNRQQYQITAYVFGLSLNPYEWVKRLNSRPGKTIPPGRLFEAALNFEYPSYEEGFDSIVEIRK